MSGFTKDSPRKNLKKQVQKKVKDLEKESLERYKKREDKVVKCLNFCVGALEDLQAWAVFAIFPQDENQSEKYLQFIDYKYNSILENSFAGA